MRSTCFSWRKRNISIKGKIAVVNFLVVSLLHFVAANSELPPRVLHELKKMITHFLWNGGSSKIAYATLIKPIREGGLKLADFEARIQAARLMLARWLLLEGESFSRDFVNYLTSDLGFPSLLLGKPGYLPPRLRFSQFYSEVFNLWQKHHDLPPTTETEVRGEAIWNNGRITMEGAPFSWESWRSHGVVKIDDIIHPTEGRFLSHYEINEKYGLNSSFLDTLRITEHSG